MGPTADTPASTTQMPKGCASDTLPYWQAASNGKLLVQKCDDCGERYHYARPFCPFCSSRSVQWLECAGTGRVYSHTFVPRAKQVIAYVTLDEGPTVLSRIENFSDPASVTVGTRVKARFITDAAGTPLLVFDPAA